MSTWTSTGTVPPDPDEPEPPTADEVAAVTAVDPVHDDAHPKITTYDDTLPVPPDDHGAA